MDDEFPKTLNAAVSTSEKVHGSLTELEGFIANLKAHLGELVTHLTAAHAAVKAGPVPEVVVSEPEPVVEAEEPEPAETDTEPVVEETPEQSRDAGGRFSKSE